MNNILYTGEVLFASGLLIMALSNYFTISQIYDSNKQVSNLNRKVCKLQASQHYHEIKLSTIEKKVDKYIPDNKSESESNSEETEEETEKEVVKVLSKL
jgi:hypothetical protein